MGSSLGTGYPRNLQGLHEIGTRQAIGLIFPPQRGEQYPLMWGFIPHARGEFSQRNIRGLDFFNWEIKTTILIISKSVIKPFNPNRSSWPAWIVFFFRRADFIPKRHNDRLGGYAFLRYCDGVIPTTCLKILVKCDIS